MNGTVAVVEDEESIRLGLKDSLELEGYRVVTAADGEEAVKIILENRPDLVILDLMLPKLPGYEVCRRIRAKGVSAFIIMLTAKKEEMDRVTGFSAGTDDYMVKPFSLVELLAKVKAIFRRLGKGGETHEFFKSGSLRIDFKKYEAEISGKKLDFSAKEFDILRHFTAHPDEVVSREDLLEGVWGLDVFPSTRTVDNFIVRLRQKLEKDPENPKIILSVRGVGYKFCPGAIDTP